MTVGQPRGQAGTGKYEGYVWDGRKWVGPDGRAGRFDPWQRTSLPLRVLLVGLAAVAVVVLALRFG